MAERKYYINTEVTAAAHKHHAELVKALNTFPRSMLKTELDLEPLKMNEHYEMLLIIEKKFKALMDDQEMEPKEKQKRLDVCESAYDVVLHNRAAFFSKEKNMEKIYNLFSFLEIDKGKWHNMMKRLALESSAESKFHHKGRFSDAVLYKTIYKQCKLGV